MKNTNKKVRENGTIMQINVNSTLPSVVITRVEDFISHNHKFFVVTPNPELILMAQKDLNLKKALNSADISIPDGVGLKIADPKLVIIKGRELFGDLITLADKKKWKIFLLGGLEKEAELTAGVVSGKYKNIKVEYAKGPKLNKEAIPVGGSDIASQKDVIAKINKFKPHLLFVAFGNPKQEIWIHKNLAKLNVGGAMAIGGTLRYVAGLSKLPPVWMEKTGLEWLYRLITEPKRIKRIINAVIIFPYKYFLYKLGSIEVN